MFLGSWSWFLAGAIITVIFYHDRFPGFNDAIKKMADRVWETWHKKKKEYEDKICKAMDGVHHKEHHEDNDK